MTTQWKPFLRKFAEFDEREAIHFDGATLTYRNLLELIEHELGNLESHGIAESETVLLDGDYTPRAIALLFALYQNNNIVALNTVASDKEIDDKCETSAASVVIGVRDELRIKRRGKKSDSIALVQRLAEAKRAGMILFSSGTTGTPKAMLHDLDRLVESYGGKRPKSINVLLFLLLDHIGGINTLLNAFGMGATVTIPVNRTPDGVCELVARYKVTLLPASPTFLNLMLISGAAARHDLGSLRMISYGTEPMPEGLLQKLRKEFPRAKFLQTFGTSETGIVSTASRSSDSLFMKFEDDSVEHKVVDGELWLRSERQILGYLNHAMSSFTDDGWFRTGDLVEVTDDGYLRVAGRSKEVINVGGEKVLPSEVESVLMHLPFVSDCKAYAQRNALTGQMVAVDVVPTSDGPGPDELPRRIRDFARANMDSYKVPVKVNIVKEIPYSHRFKKAMRREELTSE